MSSASSTASTGTISGGAGDSASGTTSTNDAGVVNPVLGMGIVAAAGLVVVNML